MISTSLIHSRQSGQRGFSLIEIVIVLFITGLMLYLVAGLTDQTFKTLKFLQEKSSTLQSASLACERLAAELREAVAVPGTSPLTFVKVRPSAPLGVGNISTQDSDDWNRTYPGPETATITYTLDPSAKKVRRRVNSEPSQDVATEVNTFQVSRYDNSIQGAYKVELTILEDRRAVTFVAYVCCAGINP